MRNTQSPSDIQRLTYQTSYGPLFAELHTHLNIFLANNYYVGRMGMGSDLTLEKARKTP